MGIFLVYKGVDFRVTKLLVICYILDLSDITQTYTRPDEDIYMCTVPG